MKFKSSFPSFKRLHSSVILLSVSLGVFLFSIFFAPLYYDGDQVVYHNAYKDVAGTELLTGFVSYQFRISTSEPIHFFIIWLANNLGLEKNFFIAIANSFLAYVTMRVFLQWRVSVYIALVVIFTNYYVLVLYFAAERLKFAFIFLMLSLLYIRNHKLSILFAITSVLTHIQQLIIYGSIMFSWFIENLIYILSTSRIGSKKIFLLIGIVFIGLFLFYFQGNQLTYKFWEYYGKATGNSLLVLWKAFSIFLLTLLYTSNRRKVISIFCIIFITVFLVGPERVNMIAYFFFMFYALQYKGGVNLGVLITSFYFGLKSIYFIFQVVTSGQGFG